MIGVVLSVLLVVAVYAWINISERRAIKKMTPEARKAYERSRNESAWGVDCDDEENGSA